MPHDDVRSRFDAYLDRLLEVARSRHDVVGVVGFGSTADRTRVDEWSDHDFAWVTEPGAEDRYRFDLGWLPDADRVALSVVEGHGGVKVVFDDGRLLEFGIANVETLRSWSGDEAAVLLDRGGVAAAVASVLAKGHPGGEHDDARSMALVCTQLLVGVGRARRGELLSAGQSVRSEAVEHLLAVLAHRFPDPDGRIGRIDPRRRFELVHPAIAARIADAQREDPETAARRLLDLAEETLSPGWPAFPNAAVDVLRTRFGWRR